MFRRGELEIQTQEQFSEVSYDSILPLYRPKVLADAGKYLWQSKKYGSEQQTV